MREKVKRTLWIVLGVIGTGIIIRNAVLEGWPYVLTDLLPILLLIMAAWLVYRHVPVEMAFRYSQNVGFGAFGVWIVTVAWLPLPTRVSGWLLFIGLFGISFSIFLRGQLPKKTAVTLEEKVKEKLKVRSKNYRKNLPRRIGGFILPAIPFFTVTSKRWKGALRKEAIIHENVHLYYLQSGWLVGVFAFLIVFSVAFNSLLGVIMPTLMVVPLVAFSAVMFEWVTFWKTQKLGKELGVTCRSFTPALGWKYMLIYTLQFLFIILAFKGVEVIIAMIRGVLG